LWLTDDGAVSRSSEGHVLADIPGNGRFCIPRPMERFTGGDGHQLFAFRGGQYHAYYQGWTQRICWHDIDSKKRVWMASGGWRALVANPKPGVQMLTPLTGWLVMMLEFSSKTARETFGSETISGLQRLHRGIFTSFTNAMGLIRGARQYDSNFRRQARRDLGLELSIGSDGGRPSLAVARQEGGFA